MTLSVQSINPKTEKIILSWGGGGAMAGALALYYFKGDNTLLKWISLILGVGGLAALGYGTGDNKGNNNNKSHSCSNLLTVTSTIPATPIPVSKKKSKSESFFRGLIRGNVLI